MQEFIDFVASQPSDKIIDHTSWYSCAIGDYADNIDQLPPSDTQLAFMPIGWGSHVKICIDNLKVLYVPNTGEMVTMYDVLEDGEITSNAIKDYEVNTYGGLHKLINYCLDNKVEST